MRKNKIIHKNHLSAKVDWGRIVDSFTKEGKQFQFPIKGIEVGTDKKTKTTIIIAGSIIAVGLILGFMYLGRKKK